MLLWCVLGGVLILIVWVLYFIFGWGTAFPVLMTILIVATVAAIWGVKKLLARRAAKRLENAIVQQASSQAMNARPERRAEIQELQKKLQEGMSALKTSKTPTGGKLGAAALYAMPWYMIIGPPGAGKTTALKHSGLVFPGGNNAGAVRGVGGTRNCDWWFTNEAIILDTAGRYTTESDDRDEWIAFLQFLLKYRQKKPINGIIVAISINELLDANEQQIETTGKKLRARIDEVITQLHMVVPVYLLFTKIDLVAGFVEFFGDLKKSDRAQVWGATIPLNASKAEPGKLFDTEFDVMVKHLHSRGLKRCVQERSREARERLFRFPIEFAALKRNLSELVNVTFAPNTFQGTPMFRGFYFTSGTQEGKPMDRVLERMSAAMGIRPQAPQQLQANPNIESKSYFLYNLFTNIIFKDGNVGVLSAIEERRQTMLKVMIAGATVGLAALLCLPAVTSYSNNKSFLDESAKKAKAGAKLNWDDDQPLSSKPPMLTSTLDLLHEHDKFQADGIPFGMGWWMYKADKVYQPTLKLYATRMSEGFVEPSKRRLEERLQTADATKYLQVRTTLKQYLMLNDVEHLDVEWATGRYTRLWVDIMDKRNDVTEFELKELIKPHIQYYFELIKRGKIEPPKLDEDLIKRVRTALQSVPVKERYYNLIVLSLNDERIDESGEPDIDNMVFPPVQLPRLFPDLPVVQKHFKSRSALENKGFKQVEGPYTDKGHAAVVEQIKAAEGLLRTESWVVPLTADETPDNIPKYVANVKTQYEEVYVQQWMEFFADIAITTPKDENEALELYTAIGTPELSPHRRLIERLNDHTQWRNKNPLESNDQVAKEVNRRFNQKLNMYTQGIVVNVDLREMSQKMDKIPSKFKRTTEFAEQPKPVGNPGGTTAVKTGNSRVFEYTEIVKALREKIEARMVAPRDPTAGPFNMLEMNEDFMDARAKAKSLLKDYDATANQLLEPLLMMPLNFGVRPLADDKNGKKPDATNTPQKPTNFQWSGNQRRPGSP
ncbi:MAG: type VI secretion system membrane subunit TssM [Polyangiaceae bacterium]|nr:type VI secretion system membrane subunit TssM [Polyangiaceae bacterium]